MVKTIGDILFFCFSVATFAEGTTTARTATRTFAVFLFDNAVYDYSDTNYCNNRSGYNCRYHIFTSSFLVETECIPAYLFFLNNRYPMTISRITAMTVNGLNVASPVNNPPI